MFDLKNFNWKTLLSLIVVIAGIAMYVGWVARYGVIYDIGIYSIVIVLVIGGILGMLISLREVEEET